MMLTQTANNQRYEVPCPLFDDLENMENSRKPEERDENNSSDLRRMITIRDPGVRVVERRVRVVFGHVDCCRNKGIWGSSNVCTK